MFSPIIAQGHAVTALHASRALYGEASVGGAETLERENVSRGATVPARLAVWACPGRLLAPPVASLYVLRYKRQRLSIRSPWSRRVPAENIAIGSRPLGRSTKAVMNLVFDRPIVLHGRV